MRARNREVNIFNMSLLDILTGMLGAFLFLMLGLVPYYTKAVHAGEDNGNKTPPVDSTLNILARWDSPAQMDFFVYSPSSGWHGADEKAMPLSRRAKISAGACPGMKTWQLASTLVNPSERCLLAYSLKAPADPESMRKIALSLEMMEAESQTDGSGLKSYYPDVGCTTLDASGSKPGVLYGMFWIDITKDETKTDYNLQLGFDTSFPTARDRMPDGAVPMPPPAPIPVTLTPNFPQGNSPQHFAPPRNPQPSPSSHPFGSPAGSSR